jgi:hypothetical protein
MASDNETQAPAPAPEPAVDDRPQEQDPREVKRWQKAVKTFYRLKRKPRQMLPATVPVFVVFEDQKGRQRKLRVVLWEITHEVIDEPLGDKHGDEDLLWTWPVPWVIADGILQPATEAAMGAKVRTLLALVYGDDQ